MTLRISDSAFISPRLTDADIEAIRLSILVGDPARVVAEDRRISVASVASARRYLKSMGLTNRPWCEALREELDRPRKHPGVHAHSNSVKPQKEMLHFWQTDRMEFCVIHPATRPFFEAEGWRYDRVYADGQPHIQMDRERS